MLEWTSITEEGDEEMGVCRTLGLLLFTHLLFDQLVQSDGVLRLEAFLLLLHLLQDEPWGEGVSIDALVATAGTLPEPTVDPLLYGLQEVLANLDR